jgi:adenine-specific DNA-methyltransferase
MGIRFIGHKQKLVSDIVSIIDSTVESPTRIGDLFTGTGSVAAGLKRSGHSVVANDILTHCCLSARAQLCNPPQPAFDTLLEEVPEVNEVSNQFIQRSGYTQTLSFLNEVEGVPGFIYSTYSPGGTADREEPRQYFTDENAKQIDAIRQRVHQWHDNGLISDNEHALLVYDLIRATNEVANTAGTYGAFLKSWYERAQEPLELTPAEIPDGPLDHEVYQQDANELATDLSLPAVYLDPPYTKRQYASYYHLPETIAQKENPTVSGKTGLPNWEPKSSDYCYKRRAGGKLDSLLSDLDTNFVFLSYSDEGHINPDELNEILTNHGSVELHTFDHKRYKSNTEAESGDLTEALYVIDFTDS